MIGEIILAALVIINFLFIIVQIKKLHKLPGGIAIYDVRRGLTFNYLVYYIIFLFVLCETMIIIMVIK